MFGWGGSDTWFSGLNTFLKGYADTAAAPFKSGVATGIDAIFTATWAGMKANPYATAATVVVGGVTLYAYKNKGFGVGLGKLHVGFNNFLAHATVKIGLGAESVANYWDINNRLINIDNRLQRLEEGQSTLAENERFRSEAHRTRASELKSTLTDLQNSVGQQFTALFQLTREQHKATSDSLQAMGLANAEANQATRRIEEGLRPKK
ncbi:MAG: hypothetical protein AB7I18_01415 [Candidatus Berkiella sp.]